MKNEFRRALKPDAEPFDEIRIVCEPRFKDSELSGSEWRTRYYTDFYRNGNLIWRNFGHTSMNAAANLFSHTYCEATENGYGMFAGEGEYCDQEGCARLATVWLEQIEEGCGRCGHRQKPDFSRPYRGFCETHANRGNSRLGDTDKSYVPLEGKP